MRQTPFGVWNRYSRGRFAPPKTGCNEADAFRRLEHYCGTVAFAASDCCNEADAFRRLELGFRRPTRARVPGCNEADAFRRLELREPLDGGT